MDVTQIKESGLFTPKECAEEYRRRGKSPLGVMDVVYKHTQRGNAEDKAVYRDRDTEAQVHV